MLLQTGLSHVLAGGAPNRSPSVLPGWNARQRQLRRFAEAHCLRAEASRRENVFRAGTRRQRFVDQQSRDHARSLGTNPCIEQAWDPTFAMVHSFPNLPRHRGRYC